MIVLQLRKKPDTAATRDQALAESLEKNIGRIEGAVREEVRANREELNKALSQMQGSLIGILNGMSQTQLEQLKGIIDTVQQSLGSMNKALDEKIGALTSKADENSKAGREELTRNLKEFSDTMALQMDKISNRVEERLKDLNLNTEKRLDQIRETVDEKLQKTLNERLGQSFELVSKQLESVQKGLGEMQTLAQDVGGLKKVLGNVKLRGGLGEVRLELLLEQILAPEQYEANVKTKKGSSDVVEFAIRLPGKDDENSVVYLPIDAKFPQEDYLQLTEAYDTGNPETVEAASRRLESVIRKMARDIRDKYIDPPNTTEFGILFLPFEGVYAEVIRRAALMETLQRDFRIIVTGPTTLAAMLNSLQMGFKTLAIQKRSSEVWKVLGAIKTEFEKFGGLLDKAKKNLLTASNQLDELSGTRTTAIRRRLRNVESLPQAEASAYLPEIGENGDEEEASGNEDQ
ncbi:MAG: DNA recombination protein RmuC [Bacteroidales bacterium]